MAKVIGHNQSGTFNVQKYNFNTLENSEPEKPARTVLRDFDGESQATQELLEPTNNIPQAQQQAAEASAAQGGMLESLLKKVDELSDGMIKMEMQMERQQAEFATRLEDERARAMEDGYNKAAAELSEKYTQKENENLRMFGVSIKKLQDSSTTFADKIAQFESELVHASLSIAEEVIKCETLQNSKNIAANLARELFSKVKEASHVTLRISPTDVPAVQEALGDNPKITIQADDAIMRGGVVLLSELGNLDGTIGSRLEKIRHDLTKE